jgi:type VI secretion system protein ImpE
MPSPTDSPAVARAHEALRAGDPDAALRHLQDGIRAAPADARLRIFLFQLLCVHGQWQRALNQLQVCGELDASTLAMVSTYREAIHCEALRASVWAGATTPVVFGQPEAWVAWLVEALQCDARGDSATAARLRNAAFDGAAITPGSLNGEPFDWIADADSRLGPVLEAVINGRYCWVPFSALLRVSIEPPSDLRDLVWAAAQLEFTNGGVSVALLPCRYPGTVEEGDATLLLARATQWRELGATASTELSTTLSDPGHSLGADTAPALQYRGLGQRMLATSAAECGLLDVREIVLTPPAGDDESSDGPAAAA